MQEANSEGRSISPEESWRTVHSAMESARSSMYLAGTTTIILLWGLVASFGLILQSTIEFFAPGFATEVPWFPGPLWGALAMAGMISSAVIGHRAGRASASGDAMRSAGIRVFLFWLAVLVAAFAIPAAAGLWNADGAENIPRVSIGVVALGLVLFGVMLRAVIAAVGVGLAAAFYIPSYLAGDAAPMVTAAAILIVVSLSAAWMRRSGVL